jgi:RNA polymerase sigma-70 factor (ECF subfamily)
MQRLSGNPDVTPETSLLRRENARRLREAVQKLPTEYRLILVLRDMEELSDEDVAEITGLRPGTIRVRLHRARLFVRKELAKQELRSMRRRPARPVEEMRHPAQPRQRHCKEMFAELSNYLEEKLDDSLCEGLEKHMEGCEPCKAFLVSLEKSIQMCRIETNESPDPRIAARLRRELLAEYQNTLANITRRDATNAMRS